MKSKTSYLSYLVSSDEALREYLSIYLIRIVSYYYHQIESAITACALSTYSRKSSSTSHLAEEVLSSQLKDMAFTHSLTHSQSGPNLDKVLHIISEGMAQKHFVRMGFDSPRDAFGVCSRRVRREFGMEAMRGQAAQIHGRVAKADVTQRVAHGRSCGGSPAS